MTLSELIIKYQNRILAASNKQVELQKIIRELNSVTEGNKPLSNPRKIEILDELKLKILNESKKHFAQSNTDYLKLIDATIDELSGK